MNLALAVTGRRPDGYHLLDTYVVFADIADELSAERFDDLSVGLAGRFAASLVAEPDNLVLRAMRLLVERGPGVGAKVLLRKSLPVAAGLGGGSADAAAALRALDMLWSLGLSRDELARAGLALGADVPMCVHGRFLRARGIGEEIELLPEIAPLHLVLVNPGVALPTGEVFGRLRQVDNPPLPDLPGGGIEDLMAVLPAMRNDLEGPAVALRPVVGEVLDALRALPSCRLARMSGSGATCFGLFGTRREAVTAAVSLAAARRDWWVVAARAR